MGIQKGQETKNFDEFGGHNSRLRDILGLSDRLATLRHTRVSLLEVLGSWREFIYTLD